MSLVIDKILDKCIVNIKDEKIKYKIETEIIDPIIYQISIKAKPYLFTLLYMYGIIVLLQIIIIVIILFKKK
jgi:hypothetical protein